MTIREILSRKKRIAVIILYTTMAVLILSTWNKNEVKPVLFLPIFIIGFSAIIYLQFGIRCPNCSERLGSLLSMGNPFSISQKIKKCPYCGIDIDSELAPKI